MQLSELEELGYKGFAIAFHSGKSQLVGTSSVLKSFILPMFWSTCMQ